MRKRDQAKVNTEAHKPNARAGVRLDWAKECWRYGDYQTLAAIDASAVLSANDLPEALGLAGMAASQLGLADLAQSRLLEAQAAGLSDLSLAGMLVDSVHAHLGRAWLLLGENEPANFHLERSTGAPIHNPEDNFGRHRLLIELAGLGLIDRAAEVIAKRTRLLQDGPALNSESLLPEVQVLRSEIEMLQHELAIAHQRNQIQVHRSLRVAGAARHAGADWARAATSQLGQDLWVLERTGFKQSGFFVEFGATDGILLSNTFLLESQFGWRGICAEPNPELFSRLIRNRRCTVANDFISGQTGELVDFLCANEYGGQINHEKEDQHTDVRKAYAEVAGGYRTLTSISLADFLKKYQAPRQIDYISIDTEGTELSILKEFPFDEWDITCLTVEHNFSSDRSPMRNLLMSKGYSVIEAEWDDWYWK
jgi:FkbM family methyltransferase